MNLIAGFSLLERKESLSYQAANMDLLTVCLVQ